MRGASAVVVGFLVGLALGVPASCRAALAAESEAYEDALRGLRRKTIELSILGAALQQKGGGR